MKANPLHSRSKEAYTDQQVFEAIRNSGDQSQLILKWFFAYVRAYSLRYLAKKYPELEAPEWDVVFAHTNLKLITRVKKGLVLEKETKLSTYYTSVANFAALDFVRDRQENTELLVENHPAVQDPVVIGSMERKERAVQIRDWLTKVVGYEDQVTVMLLHTKGYTYREIVEKTGYQSEGACRNALLKAKKKVSSYLVKNPDEAAGIRALLLGQ